MADPRNLDTVKALKRKHEAEIMRRYGATGVAIGKSGDEYVIVVYLAAKRADIEEPVVIEGVRLQFQVTGPLKIH